MPRRLLDALRQLARRVPRPAVRPSPLGLCFQLQLRSKWQPWLLVLGVVLATTVFSAINFALAGKSSTYIKASMSSSYVDFRCRSLVDDATGLPAALQSWGATEPRVEATFQTTFTQYLREITIARGGMSAAPITVASCGIDPAIIASPRVSPAVTILNGTTGTLVAGSVLVDQATAAAIGARPGDTITITAHQVSVVDGSPVTAAVNATVGAVFAASDVALFYNLFNQDPWSIGGACIISSIAAGQVLDAALQLPDGNGSDDAYHASGAFYNVNVNRDLLGSIDLPSIVSDLTRIRAAILSAGAAYQLVVDSPLVADLEDARVFVDLFRVMFVACAVPVIIVAFIFTNLAFTMTMQQRQRDMALLRLRGLVGKRLAASMVAVQATLGIAGSGAGLLAGMAFSAAIVASIFGEVLPLAILSDPVTLATNVGLGIGLAATFAVTFAKRLKSIAPLDAARQHPVSEQATMDKRATYSSLLVSLAAVVTTFIIDAITAATLPASVQVLVDVFVPILVSLTPLTPFMLSYSLIQACCEKGKRLMHRAYVAVARLFSRQLAPLVAANLSRKRGHVAQVLFLLSLAMSFSIMGNIVMSSQDAYQAGLARLQVGADVRASYTTPVGAPDPVGSWIDARPGVAAWTSILDFPWECEVPGITETRYAFMLHGVNATTYRQVAPLAPALDGAIDALGSVAAGVLVPASWAGIEGFAAGQVVLITIGSDHVPVQVAGTFDVAPGIVSQPLVKADFADIYAVHVIVNAAWLASRASAVGLTTCPATALVSLADSSAPAQSAFAGALVAGNAASHVQAATRADAEATTAQDQGLLSVVRFFDLEFWLILVLASGGLAIVATMATSGEANAIRILRLRGMIRRQVVTYYMLEAAVLAAIALVFALIGFPLGAVMNVQLDQVAMQHVAVSRPFAIAPLPLLATIATAIGTHLVVHALALWRATNRATARATRAG